MCSNTDHDVQQGHVSPMSSWAWSGIARSARKMVASRLSSKSFDQAAEPTAPDVMFRSSEDGVIRAVKPGSCAESRQS